MRRRSRAERTPPQDHSRAILRELERAGAPLAPEELARRLRVHHSERRAFDGGLAQLERAGELVRNRAGALLVAKRLALVAGRVTGHPDGHGFLDPDDGSPGVVLPAAEMRQLMHGDRAAVRI